MTLDAARLVDGKTEWINEAVQFVDELGFCLINTQDLMQVSYLLKNQPHVAFNNETFRVHGSVDVWSLPPLPVHDSIGGLIQEIRELASKFGVTEIDSYWTPTSFSVALQPPPYDFGNDVNALFKQETARLFQRQIPQWCYAHVECMRGHTRGRFHCTT